MLSSLLRPSHDQHRRSGSPADRSLLPPRGPTSSSSPDTGRQPSHGRRASPANINAQQSSSGNADDEDIEEEADVEEEEDVDDEDEDESGQHSEDNSSDEDDADNDTTPLLPIFSSAHLDALPIFTLTHSIRLLVESKCETVLSWDQLRSPQVSQFLLKPIQSEIRANHFSAATEYALLANCLQFNKEGSMYPGNSGTSKTRAMVCELIAIKMLREYSTRELIDALSYDFDPLQGQPGQEPSRPEDRRPTWEAHRRAQTRSARISCLEIAIRAQAKRFLAHPLVVQQLEAIWDGSIIFHSAADSLHRRRPNQARVRAYGTNADQIKDTQVTPRRTVTLYNPRDASLFKLSRLRVPKYRNILSTGSFAILLGLFLAVLVQRSLEITTLEVVFWFWSAGYMLDEIVGFNEQGFSLYIASFWNTFDLGILLILFVHLCLRIYGIVMPDVRKHTVANMAYDVLAADAILLFPRLFSVLDHYRYFSQLLIAFRMMAADLMAVFVLILISCSGFLVALTLSFGNEGIDTPQSVAYALLQMLMGFTPAAWDRWDGYNALGKTILTLFLFICHFLVVTILITVLTNSFMAIVQNANEEHQFVFAVNTISNVKSDALFSYVAPTNILQWLLTPLRYCLPFRQYLKLNRTMIKVTHFPILFTIYFYEKTILRATVVDTIDIVEKRGRKKSLFTNKLPRLAREPSIATFRQDRALEEVFRRPFDSTMRNSNQSQERRKTSNVVSNWMKDIDEGLVSPQQEDEDRKIVDRLEQRRRPSRRFAPARRIRDGSRRTMSVASNPEDFTTGPELFSPRDRTTSAVDTTPSQVDAPTRPAGLDGDSLSRIHEHAAEDGDILQKESLTPVSHHSAQQIQHHTDYFNHRQTPKSRTPELGTSITSGRSRTRFLERNLDGTPPSRLPPKRRPRPHARNVSSATMIYNPHDDSGPEQYSSQDGTAVAASKDQLAPPGSGTRTPPSKPTSSAAGRKTPRKHVTNASRLRPMLPGQDHPGFRSTPNIAGSLPVKTPANEGIRRRPSLEMDLVSDIGDNKAIGGGYIGAIPASFATQMAYATGGLRQAQQRKEEQEMFGRLMMTRMNSLEEGFREVIHEMRESMRGDGAAGIRSRSLEGIGRTPAPVVREKRGRNAKGKEQDRTEVSRPSTSAGPVAGGNKENEDPKQDEEAAARVSAPQPAKGTDKMPATSEKETEGRAPTTEPGDHQIL